MVSADALDDDNYIAWSDEDTGPPLEPLSEDRSSDQNGKFDRKIDNERSKKKRRIAPEKPAKLDVIDERDVPQDKAAEAALKIERRREERRNRAERKRTKNNFGAVIAPAELVSVGPEIVVGHLQKLIEFYNPAFSSLEVLEKSLQESSIVPSISWKAERNEKTLLPFMIHYLSREKVFRSTDRTGSPYTLILVSSALRVSHLCAALRESVNADSQSKKSERPFVAKVFGKHFKLKDQIEQVKQERMSITVATPNRAIQLSDAGALSFAHLSGLVVDTSHMDAKERTIWDNKEVNGPLGMLLMQKQILKRDRKGKLKVVLF